jgi:hypothetical protein
MLLYKKGVMKKLQRREDTKTKSAVHVTISNRFGCNLLLAASKISWAHEKTRRK